MITLTSLAILKINGHKISECNKKFLILNIIIDTVGLTNFIYNISKVT